MCLTSRETREKKKREKFKYPVASEKKKKKKKLCVLFLLESKALTFNTTNTILDRN